MGLIEVVAIVVFLSAIMLLVYFVKKNIIHLKKSLFHAFIVPVVLLIFISILIVTQSYWTASINISSAYFNIVNIIQILWWLVVYWLLNLVLNRIIWVFLLEQYQVFVPKIIKDFFNILLILSVVACISHFIFHSNLLGFFTLGSVLAVVLGYSAQILTKDIFSGIGLNMFRQFIPGDWVKLYQVKGPNFIGKVEEINSRFVLLSSIKNEKISIPNSLVVNMPIKNISHNKGIHINFNLPIFFPHVPTKVKEIINLAINEIPEVKTDPKPIVNLIKIESPMFEYEVNLFSAELDTNLVIDKVLTNIWYKFEKSYLHFNDLMTQELVFPNQEEIQGFLKNFDLFSTLTEKELVFLSKKSKVKFYGPTERILKQNSKSSNLYIIYSGGVDIYLNLENDIRKKVASLPKNTYFGEMSLLTGQLTTASVISNSESYILKIDHKTMAQLFKERPELIQQISEIIIERKFSNKEFIKQHKHKKDEKMGMIAQLFNSIKNFFK